MQWLELSINTTPEAVDWVSTMLGTTAYAGDVRVTDYQQDLSQQNLSDSSPPLPDWRFTLCLYLPHDFRANAQLEAIAQRLASLHRTGQSSELQTAIVERQPVPAVDRERRHRVGQRFVILAPETLYHPKATDITIRLKPSLSFGSGLHPTTVVSLQLLERHILPSMQGLDLGSGSGILSVAIAKLGANVLALDNDPIAVQSTQDAVARNGVDRQVTVMAGSLGGGSSLGHWMGGETAAQVPTISPTGSFDFVVANLLARVHIALANDFQQALRRTAAQTGLLIIAGFTCDYEDELTTALTAAGFAAVDCERLNEWVALAYRLT
jgi:ribosomal protein L11 methyltransferase